MVFFDNLNLAPYTITPIQGSDGKFFMFFGTIPHEVVLYNFRSHSLLRPHNRSDLHIRRGGGRIHPDSKEC
jgi:hypothetical protein